MRWDDIELVSIGRNTVFSCADPSSHAELNAIRGIVEVLGRPRAPNRVFRWADAKVPFDAPGRVYLRRPPAAGDSRPTLYTSLEPCPMCSVGILNSPIQRVVIAQPDPRAGSLLSGRLAMLPPVWGELAVARRLQVELLPEAPVGGALRDVLLRSQPALDRLLASRGAYGWDQVRGALDTDAGTTGR